MTSKKRIAYLTDIHLDEDFPREQGVNSRENWRLVLEDVANRQIDDVFLGGDIGEPSANKSFFESLERYSSNLKISLGNHDLFAEVKKHYKNIPTETDELYDSYEDEHFKYIWLDSSSNEVSSTQLQWLQQELHTTKKVILFIHHPVLAVNTAVDKLYPLRNREAVQQILQKHEPGIIIFCGHYHMRDEQTQGHITQYITPACSCQIEKTTEAFKFHNRNFGYRIIEIDGAEIKTEVVLCEDGVFGVEV